MMQRFQKFRFRLPSPSTTPPVSKKLPSSQIIKFITYSSESSLLQGSQINCWPKIKYFGNCAWQVATLLLNEMKRNDDKAKAECNGGEKSISGCDDL